jgi:hypothetical protein
MTPNMATRESQRIMKTGNITKKQKKLAGLTLPGRPCTMYILHVLCCSPFNYAEFRTGSKFLVLPYPDPLVRDTDSAPDPSSSSKNIKKKTFVSTLLRLCYDFLSLTNNGNVSSKSNKQKHLEKKMFL